CYPIQIPHYFPVTYSQFAYDLFLGAHPQTTNIQETKVPLYDIKNGYISYSSRTQMTQVRTSDHLCRAPGGQINNIFKRDPDIHHLGHQIIKIFYSMINIFSMKICRDGIRPPALANGRCYRWKVK